MIKRLWDKYKEYILYVIFGVLTTVVNYVVYFIVTLVFKLNVTVNMFGHESNLGILIANVVAWIVAVAFSFVTTKTWVFESKTRGSKVVKEIIEFVTARLLTLGIEEVMLVVFVNILGFNDIVIKLIASVITVVLNYIFSKFIIFKKSKAENNDEAVSE